MAKTASVARERALWREPKRLLPLLLLLALVPVYLSMSDGGAASASAAVDMLAFAVA